MAFFEGFVWCTWITSSFRAERLGVDGSSFMGSEETDGGWLVCGGSQSYPVRAGSPTSSVKSKMAKLKRLLRVQPSGRRKDEPQRGFISVRYYEV